MAITIKPKDVSVARRLQTMFCKVAHDNEDHHNQMIRIQCDKTCKNCIFNFAKDNEGQSAEHIIEFLSKLKDNCANYE